MSKRAVVVIACLVSLIILVAIPLMAKTTIKVWQPWGPGQIEKGKAIGVCLQNFREIAKDFEKTHPDIKVEVECTPAHETNDKLMVAIAGGIPPDVTLLVGFQVAEWAESGIVQALDKYASRDRIIGDDFFTPAWNRNFYEGKLYAMTFCADPNFGMARNVEAFEEAGLDWRKSPETIPELDETNHKLTAFDSGGKMKRFGIIPWDCYGYANTIRTWGWAFGGEFVDMANKRITADHSKVVRALEWILSYIRKYGPTLRSWPADFAAFAGGKVGLHPYGPWDIPWLQKAYPELKLAIGNMPYYPGENRYVAWVGGWSIGIPVGARNPDAAWEFIRWVTATPEGTESVSRNLGFYTAYRKNLFFDTLKGPMLAYLGILQTAPHTYYAIPVESTLMLELDRAVALALSLEKTPQEALKNASVKVQQEWEKVLAKRGKK